MTLASPITVADDVGGRPRDDELDLFGLTHPGRVREHNDGNA